MQGQQSAGAAVGRIMNPVDAQRDMTLNERLNKASETLAYQCERIEGLLARVNGTPTSPDKLAGANVKPPLLALGTVVENVEQSVQQLVGLCSGLDRIA